jgi:FkbM family methyltransferase
LQRHPIEYRRRWPELARIRLRRGDTLVDAGAHIGDFAECALAYQPWLSVHAFEPLPEAFQTLAERFGSYPHFSANQTALGRTPGVRRFHVSRYSVASSFFELGRELQVGLYGRDFSEDRAITVQVDTLEGYCARHSLRRVRLLKLDVQGAELEVLEGTGSMLDETDYVYTEAQFGELYRGAPRFGEICRFLHGRGFELLCMVSFGLSDAGDPLECDMLFRRRGVD